ncbi:hypothetical protein FRC04_009024 [Tulasnella sp. 424]|nr:hypothetical protein FRC04_009024 [Tulasnella sp. 424]KAG8958651.1 hypothetical protein FRC05_008724 [Tulasnella sp. 425]
MPTHLLIYNRDDEPNTPPPSNADILNDLVHHIPGVHWRHAAKMGRKIDRERVLRALETYLSAPHTPGLPVYPATLNLRCLFVHLFFTAILLLVYGAADPLPPAHDGSHANNEAGTSQTSQGVEYERPGEELTNPSVPGTILPAPGAQDRAILVDLLAEAIAILSIQRETAYRAIPRLAKNFEDEKMLLDDAKAFIQEARNDSIPTSMAKLNVGHSAERLDEQVVKAEKWLETNGYALGEDNVYMI